MHETELSLDFGGRTLFLRTGKVAKQADASVIAQYGDTVVLVAICSSKTLKEGQDFFPLTVDYQEKYYAAGRIPGGFFKREAKPSDRATLSARLIDRPMRPLFPEDYLCDTFVTVTVLSADGVNEPDLVATIAASAAAHISDIPWAGPVVAVRVGRLNGEFVLNPSPEQQATSDLELLVAAVKTGVIMVEGSSKEVSEQVMVDALDFAHQSMMPIFAMQEELRKKVGKEKRDYPKPARDEKLKASMKEALYPKLRGAFAIREKLQRYTALGEVGSFAKEKFAVADAKTKEDAAKNKLVSTYFEELKASYARELTLDGSRIDGRGYTDIRAISGEVGLLPRVHGTGLFTRGETQVLAAVTLGTSDDEQKIDGINGTYQKSFLLHYNFPPYSVGEARPLRPPGRREIGHGFLAERALSYVIPPKEVFPYTIRLVSEVFESNGSSSMATVCSGSMALMDAGVPIPKPVAGVAMGLIKEDERVAVLTDILGDEDHLGDMDFKVCGTADGITAFQMDLKIGGVSREIMERALEQAKEGRLFILGKMAETIAAPRQEISQYAPRIFAMKVRPDKVREVIGSGGKVVRGIIEQTGVKIDIEDDGTIHIASADEKSAKKAMDLINQIVQEPEVGKIYEGKVSRIADFGAFVEIFPGTDGLCHISELAHERVRRVEDVVREGEIIQVKCLEVDTSGKIRLSRKAILPRDPNAGGGGDRPARPEGRGEGEAPREVTAREARPPRADRDERPPRGEDRPERAARPPREREERPEGRPEPREAREPREDREPREERGPRPERFERPERSEGRPEGRPESRDVRPPRGDREERGPRDRDGEERPFRGAPRAEGGRDARPARSDEDDNRGNRVPRDDRGGRGGDRGPVREDDRWRQQERGGRDRTPSESRGPSRGEGRSERGPRDGGYGRDRGNDRGGRGPASGGGGRDRDRIDPVEARERLQRRGASEERGPRDEEPRRSSGGGRDRDAGGGQERGGRRGGNYDAPARGGSAGRDDDYRPRYRDDEE